MNKKYKKIESALYEKAREFSSGFESQIVNFMVRDGFFGPQISINFYPYDKRSQDYIEGIRMQCYELACGYTEYDDDIKMNYFHRISSQSNYDHGRAAFVT